MWFVSAHTHLAGFEEVKADVGVTCCWIHAVMAEVLTDVFWCGLRKKAVYALPKKNKSIPWGKCNQKKKSSSTVCYGHALVNHNHIAINVTTATQQNSVVTFHSVLTRNSYPACTSRGATDAWNLIPAHFLLKHFEIKGCLWKQMRARLHVQISTSRRTEQVIAVFASPFPHPHLSASTSRGVFPWAQLFTIQPESMAARKPRAMPVPMGQKGCRHNQIRPQRGKNA